MKLIALILGFTFTCGLALCFIAGFFDPLKTEIKTLGPYYLVYREYEGPAQGARAAINDVRSYLKKKSGTTFPRGFITYLDDPHEQNGAAVRCIAGCITDSLLPVSDGPYKTKTLPAGEMLSSSFRYRSFFSFMTGAMKFHPNRPALLKRYGRAEAGPVTEIHDCTSGMLIYLVPTRPVRNAPETIH